MMTKFWQNTLQRGQTIGSFQSHLVAKATEINKFADTDSKISTTKLKHLLVAGVLAHHSKEYDQTI